MSKKILSFIIKGDFAMFRKPWTNKSRKSYRIPPKTTLVGMVSAILGIDKKDYIDKVGFDNTKLGIKVESNLNTYVTKMNYINSKEINSVKLKNPFRNPKRSERSPSLIELVKNPKYKIFFHNEDKNLMNKLERRLKNDKYGYNPYLGRKGFFCDISNIKKEEFIEKNINTCDTILPSNMIDLKSFEGFTNTEKIPIKMDKDRGNPKFASFVFSKNKIPIKGNSDIENIMGVVNENERVFLF
ncbi:MAG: type I-B CRISPR-associated protein Cas5b [archaeon]